MTDRLHVLIMAGGSGTRFWPWSREQKPKQLLPVAGDRSLLGQTVARARLLCPQDRIWVLTRTDLVEAIQADVPELDPSRIIAEPEGRDTAPCLVLAAARVEQVDPEATLLVLPADHVIADEAAFQASVQGACEALASRGGLFTFGIRPTYPATGYGYIRRDSESATPAGTQSCFDVVQFREKPNAETAAAYLQDGGYYWNAGIFLWRLETFRSSLATAAPEFVAGWDRLRDLGPDLGASTEAARATLAERFRELPRISIDFALMEKADQVRVVEAGFPWDDVGSWRSLETYRAPDDAGNVTEGRVILQDAKDCTILASGDRVVAARGVEGLVIVETEDALLVCPRDRVEEVKKLIEETRERGWNEVL